MHDLAFEHSAAGDGRSAGLEPKLSQEVMDFWAKPVACRMLVDSTLLPVNFGHVGLAESSRRLHQRVQNDLQIEGRAADDLEHIGGGGLLLQQLAQLVEQPRIFDGYDGLRCKVAQQIDLLVSESTHLLAKNADRADQVVVLEHG